MNTHDKINEKEKEYLRLKYVKAEVERRIDAKVKEATRQLIQEFKDLLSRDGFIKNPKTEGELGVVVHEGDWCNRNNLWNWLEEKEKELKE